MSHQEEWMPKFHVHFDGLKGGLMNAFHDFHKCGSKWLDDAVRQAVDPVAIQATIDAEVRRCLNEAVKEEIQSFFKYSGNGRKAIAEAVKRHMDQYIKDTEELYGDRS